VVVDRPFHIVVTVTGGQWFDLVGVDAADLIAQMRAKGVTAATLQSVAHFIDVADVKRALKRQAVRRT
jgi:hypothetical protein